MKNYYILGFIKYGSMIYIAAPRRRKISDQKVSDSLFYIYIVTIEIQLIREPISDSFYCLFDLHVIAGLNIQWELYR